MACSNPSFFSHVLDWKKRPVPIPCGKCMCCRASKVSMMEQRAKWEYNNHRTAAFVTFTYDDNHLPFENGFYKPTLRRNHLHRYIDTIRHNLKNSRVIFPKDVDKNFTFVASGEYGDKFKRPHYHVIFFGLSPSVTRSLLLKSWRNGSVSVLPVKQGCIRYVIKYLSKQEFGKHADSAYFDTGRESPFVMISKGFGSGLFRAQQWNIAKFGMMKFGQKMLPVPQYYKNKYFNLDKDVIIRLDEERIERERNIYETVAKPQGYESYEDYHWRTIRNREENEYWKAVSRRETVFHDYSFPVNLVRKNNAVSVSELVYKLLEVS